MKDNQRTTINRHQDFCFETARGLAKKIRHKEVSSVEVVEAYLEQIERINPQVNAIVSLSKECALEEAQRADQQLANGHEVGLLHGLPIAIKDYHDVAGLPTTCGSLALKDHVPTQDDLMVSRLRAAGAVILGKTNVPEFVGAHTFNEVFGTTHNPYNLTRTAGGSSGGAAAALASGMLPLADGSDMGGSCRFPAAFCNVVGMRTSPGRIPMYPKKAAWSGLLVPGPMARNVEDTAYMLSVMAGPDSRSPISIDEGGERFLNPLNQDLKGLRIAFSPDLGGIVPVDPEVKEVFKKQVKVFEDLGYSVEEASPDFADAEDIFRVLRAWEFEMTYSELFDRFKELMKPSFIWNVEEGRRLQGIDIGRAYRLRTDLFHRMRQFFETYDVLLLPVSQVPPFDGQLEYPKKIDGVQMETYLDWMRSCYFISATGNPALSVPGGFTSDGMPLGLQIVGPHRADFKLLQVAYLFEQATQYNQIRPEIVSNK